MTILRAVCTIRSPAFAWGRLLTVGIPSGRVRPSPLGISTRLTGCVKGFGCRPDASVRPGIGGPASESLRRTNPRESDERLIVYGDLVRQRLWRGMFFGRSLRAESR